MKTKEKLPGMSTEKMQMSTKEMQSIGNIVMILPNIASTTLFKRKKMAHKNRPELNRSTPSL